MDNNSIVKILTFDMNFGKRKPKVDYTKFKILKELWYIQYGFTCKWHKKTLRATFKKASNDEIENRLCELKNKIKEYRR